jgi:hypothetical protein
MLLAIARLSSHSRASNIRTKLLADARDKDDISRSEYLRLLLRGIEKEADDVIAGLVDRSGALPVGGASEGAAAVAVAGGVAANADVDLEARKSAKPMAIESAHSLAVPNGPPIINSAQLISLSESETKFDGNPTPDTLAHQSSSPTKEQLQKVKAPSLSPSQLRMAASLNAIPHLTKKLAYIDGVLNSHAIVIARPDRTPVKWAEQGLGVCRAWAEWFEL